MQEKRVHNRCTGSLVCRTGAVTLVGHPRRRSPEGPPVHRLPHPPRTTYGPHPATASATMSASRA
ncbi:hypothetical protein QFZ75_003065 [Streptomyces sp. V3I8]|nr:hypothetical protein [Streptomyces sp. V3I8]